MNNSNISTLKMYLISIGMAVEEIDLVPIPDDAFEELERLCKEADDAVWAVNDFKWED